MRADKRGGRFAVKGLTLKRNIVCCCALVCMLCLAVPTAALSRNGAVSPSSVVVLRGSASGTVTIVTGPSFTIQTPGRATGVINALTVAATSITNRDYPYVYGGGHAQAGVASIGIKGHGYNGRRIGFDCSGSVAAVLATAGLWPAGAGVPNDAGVIAQLLRQGLIAPGVGTGPLEVTLYDHPGVHIFMNIDGRFFGTSDGGGGGNPRGGAGWLSDGAPDASSPAYKRYHVLPSVLRASTSAAHAVTFTVGSAAGLAVGENVQIGYEELASGSLIATTVGYPDAITTGGTIQAVAPDGSSFTVQTPNGASVTLSTASLVAPIEGLSVGDTVQVTYTAARSATIVLAVNVTGTPAGSSGAGGMAGSGG
jgi:hypothetical protein